jgi:hypothetical protein
MTAWCDVLALLAFALAVIVALVADNPPRAMTWPVMVGTGLFLWLLPVALTAVHVAHS